MNELPVGTVTFVFTDIEGSTRLLKRLGTGYASLLTRHRELVRNALEQNRGREMDTQGEGFFLAFGRAKDAVAAAVAIQRTHDDEALARRCRRTCPDRHAHERAGALE